jgi:hypothetical protein
MNWELAQTRRPALTHHPRSEGRPPTPPSERKCADVKSIRGRGEAFSKERGQGVR